MGKKMKCILSTMLILSMLMINAYANEENSYTKEEVRQDIEFMFETMESVHPNLYFGKDKDEIEEKIESKLDEIESPVNETEIYKAFQPIVSSLGDGHTSMQLPKSHIEYIKDQKNILSIQVEIKDGKAYLKNPYDSTYKKEILSINGKDMKTIYEEMIPYVSGKSMSFREVVIQKNFIMFYYVNNGFADTYDLKIQDEKGNVETMSIDGMDFEGMKSSSTVKSSNDEKRYTYEVIDGNIALITFNQFWDLEAFKTFLEDSFDDMKEKNITNLVIDIRKNGGGNSRLGDLLIEYIYDGDYTQVNRGEMKVSQEIIEHYCDMHRKNGATEDEIAKFTEKYSNMMGGKDRQKVQEGRQYMDEPAFTGEVYVLIGRNTFSSATMFAATVKDYNMAHIIGEETGGLATHYGDLYMFDLPNSKVGANVSHKYFVRANGLDTGRGVIPHYDVKNLEDRDELDIAVEMIKNKN